MRHRKKGKGTRKWNRFGRVEVNVEVERHGYGVVEAELEGEW